jgi:glutathione S-transferase
MAIEFYYGSGSPYAWRVWLALEHKAIPYVQKVMSFAEGDLKKPAYTALNPRQKVPAIVDNGFVLYESAAILEYLDEAHPGSGHALFPDEVKARARARRLVREADEYLAHPMEDLVEQILFTKPPEQDARRIAAARDRFVAELATFERELKGDFLCGEAGAADFTVYPLLALTLRMEIKKPDLAVRKAIPPKMSEWMKRVEALPYFRKTWPSHWV